MALKRAVEINHGRGLSGAPLFGHTLNAGGSSWNYYSLYVADTGPHGAAGDPMNGWTVRNNTFELPAFLSSSSGSNGTRWVGNVGGFDCRPGITYRYNVGTACSSPSDSMPTSD